MVSRSPVLAPLGRLGSLLWSPVYGHACRIISVGFLHKVAGARRPELNQAYALPHSPLWKPFLMIKLVRT